jgi:hypothetical protein
MYVERNIEMLSFNHGKSIRIAVLTNVLLKMGIIMLETC